MAGRPEGERAVVQVRGELDSATCEELIAAFHAALAEGAKALTLDLQDTTFIDSAGTRALIMIERLAAEHDVALIVEAPPERVTESLRIAGFADRVPLAADPPAAPSPASDFSQRIELGLPREPGSPARARAEVRTALREADQNQVANIVLLTSELVTNAVIHPRGVGQTPIGLQVLVYDDRVRVEVEDAGAGFARVVPVPVESERGRGLVLVDHFADRWGSGRVQTSAGGRFRVWFEMDLHQAEQPEEG